uniref:Headcase protein n=1 Tax=Scolopendra viridis TaxID=118503 RepID=A0A4D5R8V5_SCOVI
MPHNRDSRGGRQIVDGEMQNYQEMIENHNPNITFCCVPMNCYIGEPIHLDELDDVVKVSCNNEQCQEGTYMHRICFEAWEQTVLTYLRSTGRARSWSEKQRLQNLWTKKGYDLAFKACGCKCAKGHLRKDLDWFPTKPSEDSKKKKNRKKRNDKPALGTTSVTAVGSANGGTVSMGSREGRPVLRIRTNSMSSTGSSPPNSSSAESPSSPTNSGSGSRRRSKFEFFSDRQSGGSSIFNRRLDYSSFNTLPRHKINSYHIKMEDDGNHGNDDTRCFILSNLAACRSPKTSCILCHNTMLIFDRYPLVDGTFFLSPRQHSKSCIPVKLDGRQQYLNAVCMGCLEGWTSVLRCRYCHQQWNGSSLILGTMYSYDIFAATPCCADRLRCNNCHLPVILPEQRLAFFSDYSHSLPCPHCNLIDFHFVKSLSTYNQRRE